MLPERLLRSTDSQHGRAQPRCTHLPGDDRNARLMEAYLRENNAGR